MTGLDPGNSELGGGDVLLGGKLLELINELQVEVEYVGLGVEKVSDVFGE